MQNEIEMKTIETKNINQRRERKLNNVKVEYYNCDVGFGWKRLFSWNDKKEDEKPTIIKSTPKKQQQQKKIIKSKKTLNLFD